MRILSVIAIWIVLVGGMALYMGSRGEAPELAIPERATAQAAYSLTVTTSLTLEPDPFALRTAPGETPPSLRVVLNGTELLHEDGKVDAGQPIAIESLPGLKQGQNEFVIEANPPEGAWDTALAVRLRLMRGVQQVDETTLWSEPGERIAASWSITIDEQAQENEHAH